MPKKVFVGEVISDRMDKTVTVAVTRMVKHPRYKKYIKRTTKLKAHDEDNACRVGDIVKVIESRPLSKTKRWIVIERIGSRLPGGVDIKDEVPLEGGTPEGQTVQEQEGVKGDDPDSDNA